MTLIAALTDVGVDYPRGPALGPFSLAIGAGEIVALVGPSGCGKSTALRLLAGLEGPTRGAVTRAAGRGETAVVFQAPTLAPWLTARANAALPLELAGAPRAQAAARADQALARVGLAGAEAARPAQLSGGMAMRASLARALDHRAQASPAGRTVRGPRRDHPPGPGRRRAGALGRDPAGGGLRHPQCGGGGLHGLAGGGDDQGPRPHRRRGAGGRSPPPPRGLPHHRGFPRPGRGGLGPALRRAWREPPRQHRRARGADRGPAGGLGDRLPGWPCADLLPGPAIGDRSQPGRRRPGPAAGHRLHPGRGPGRPADRQRAGPGPGAHRGAQPAA